MLVQFIHSEYSVITSALAMATPQSRESRSSAPMATGRRAWIGRGGTRRAVISHKGIHRNPIAPVTRNAERHPKAGAIDAITNGARMLPELIPIDCVAVPRP